MSKDDLRSFFSPRLETNNSVLTNSPPLKPSAKSSSVFGGARPKKPKTTIPSKKQTSSEKRSRHVFGSEKIYSAVRIDGDDDDDSDFDSPEKLKKKRRLTKKKESATDQVSRPAFSVDADEIQDCDSDSSVLIVGSLADDQKKSQTASTSSRQLLLVNERADNKRNEKDQLLSRGATQASFTTAPTSVPRRIGASVAEKRVRTERSAKWVPVNEMCRFMELDGKFTAVDVGRVNMGIIQISCSEKKMKILDWKLLDLNKLCQKFEEENPQELFATGVGIYSDESHCHCLAKWVAAQSKNNGIFDSSMVIIEAQSFSKEMAKIQQAINTALILSKPSVMIRTNDPELGGEYLREANFVSPAQISSANSVKTCYSTFFPRVTETQSTYYANNPSKVRKAHGMGDFQNDNEVTSSQYKANKKNAIKYGQMLISIDKILALLDSKMTDDEKNNFRSKKKDDIYDALWIVLYSIECWLPAAYGRRVRGMGAKNTMYGAMPLPRYRTFDAMFEFAESIGTPQNAIDSLREAMNKAQKEDDALDSDI